jgi:hypothetical protein
LAVKTEAEICDEAVRLAAQYSIDTEHTRYALRRAEMFHLGSFWHRGRLKTENQLRAELRGTGLPESLGWVLDPSLAHALSLTEFDPGLIVRLFERPEPWSVRQRRLLLLAFVPFSDLPFYTWGELASSLESFHGFLISQRDALVRTGMPQAQFTEFAWLHDALAPLYPDASRLPRVAPQLRERLLAAKIDIIKLLASGVREVAGSAGGRTSKRAASGLWGRCRSYLGAHLTEQEILSTFRRDFGQLDGLSQSADGDEAIGWGALAGSITALTVVAMHCCKELDVGTFHKTRSSLGWIVRTGSGGRPALALENLPASAGYKALLLPDSESKGTNLDKTVALHASLIKCESVYFRQHVTDLVSYLQRILASQDDEPEIPSLPDTLFDVLLALCRKLQSPLARIRLGLDLTTGIAVRPKLPKGTRWGGVQLAIEDGTKLRIRATGDHSTENSIALFAELTFRDMRRPDELVPNAAWTWFSRFLEKVDQQAGVPGVFHPGTVSAPPNSLQPNPPKLPKTVDQQPDAPGTPPPGTVSLVQSIILLGRSKAEQGRDLDKHYVKTINDKLKLLFGMSEAPITYDKGKNVYRVLFEVPQKPSTAKPPPSHG